MAYTRAVQFSQVNTFGNSGDEDDVYTVQGFRRIVQAGGFVDSDGFGYPVRDGLADTDRVIKPSKISRLPPDATHVVWYNR
jgi:hypothetical protein